MTTIQLYQYNGDNRTVNKVLTAPVVLQGSIHNNIDTLTPVITVRYKEVFKFNYCYIPVLGRYYFIDNITATGGNTYELYLSCDVLHTYSNEILQATATAIENDTPNKHISNRVTVYDRTPQFEKLTFPTKGVFNKEGKIIMITIKGNK